MGRFKTYGAPPSPVQASKKFMMREISQGKITQKLPLPASPWITIKLTKSQTKIKNFTNLPHTWRMQSLVENSDLILSLLIDLIESQNTPKTFSLHSLP